MSGMMILGGGVGLITLAAALFIASIVYRKTTGKKIREELKNEYE